MFVERYAEIAKKTLKNCKARIDTPDASAFLITLYNRETKAVSLEVLHRRPGAAVFSVLKTKTLASDGIKELLTDADAFVTGELDARMTLPSEDMIDFADLCAADLQEMETALKATKDRKAADPVIARSPTRERKQPEPRPINTESPVPPAAAKESAPPAPPSDKPADKNKPFGVSISALSRWMGANGFATEQIFQAYSDFGIATAINRQAVISYARLGRNNDTSRGPLPELPPDAIKQLNAYKKSGAAA